MNRQLVLAEVQGVLRNPGRVGLLAAVMLRDSWQMLTQQRHLYSYAMPRRDTRACLDLVMQWIQRAQRPDGGISSYYSLLSGYGPSYPETTGYLIPTCYTYASLAGADEFRRTAVTMTQYLLSVQLSSGAFPGMFAGHRPEPSVFNTGQILMGLVRAYQETGDEKILRPAFRAGDWLVQVQCPDGRWEGPTYQGRCHTYYTMVGLALALLSTAAGDRRYADAARANAAWALRHQRESGWFDGINVRGHPNYLHFLAYILQGLLETGILLDLEEARHAAIRSAWRLLRMFETLKYLPGAFEQDWRARRRFACITGNAQTSCIWLRLYHYTEDLRYLNAALKANEYVKERLVQRGPRGVRGGVAGSYPIWGRYHRLHYINWGAKFVADALMGELEAMEELRR